MACFADVSVLKIVWQHIQGVVGFFMTTLLQI